MQGCAPAAFLSPAVMSLTHTQNRAVSSSDSMESPCPLMCPPERLCVLRPRRTSLISSFTLQSRAGSLTLPQEAQCPLQTPSGT